MTKTASALALTLLLSLGARSFAQEISELPLPAGGNGRSQRAEVSQWIGPVRVSIDYHGPSVHGRGDTDRSGHIWGDLVPYGLFDDGHGPSRATPWRAGANETTTITLSHDVKVEGRDLKAGTYGLFLELDQAGPWTWIFSSASTGWGSYQYDPANDVLRVPATPRDAPFSEFLTYGFERRREDSAVAYLQWENKLVPFEIEVPNVNEIYVAEMRRQLLAWPGFNYQNWQTAAQFCADAKINLEEALVWANRAIEEPFRGASFGHEDFSTLRTKAAVLEAMGRDGEAKAVMDKALALPGTPAIPLYLYASGLLAAGKKAEALEVARINVHNHPEEPFWTYLGLARAYGAAGERANAIKNWEVALQHLPESQRANEGRYRAALAALRDGSGR